MSGSPWYGSSIICCATSIRKKYRERCAFSLMYKKEASSPIYYFMVAIKGGRSKGYPVSPNGGSKKGDGVYAFQRAQIYDNMCAHIVLLQVVGKDTRELSSLLIYIPFGLRAMLRRHAVSFFFPFLSVCVCLLCYIQRLLYWFSRSVGHQPARQVEDSPRFLFFFFVF